MKIAVGCDHAGFPLKEVVLESVRAAGHDVIDVGTFSMKAVDFPDFTKGKWKSRLPIEYV